MKVNPTPPIDAPLKVESVTVPVRTPEMRTGLGEKAAALAAFAGAAAALDLSPLGRGVAALASFGFPVVEIGPEGHEDPNTLELPPSPPGQSPAEPTPPGGAARHVAQALAGALSLDAAEATEQAVQDAQSPADTATATATEQAMQAPASDAAARQPGAPPTPQQQAAGALLNAMLSAALTGQTALEVKRQGRAPAQMELEREADGQGGHRIARIRLRHQTEDGVIDVTAELALGAAFPGDHAPMSVDITGSGALGGEAAAHLNELRESLQARGLAANVRARLDD